MRPVAELPEVHLFVCANRRDAQNPLGAGCGQAGQEVYAALKEGVARRRAFRAVWVTQTQCLGVCPKHGATVASYPRQALFTEVVAADAPRLLEMADGLAGQGP